MTIPKAKTYMSVMDDKQKGRFFYTIALSYGDMTKCQFTPTDEKVLEECKKSKLMSENILGVHLILTRMEEAFKREMESKVVVPEKPSLILPSTFTPPPNEPELPKV